MLRGLRLRLTLLYTLAALILVGLIGGGAYVIVARYFQLITDLALQHKMVHEFHALAAPIPPRLAPADRDWSIVRKELGLLPHVLSHGSGGMTSDVERLAREYYPDSPVHHIEVETEQGRQVFEVEFRDGTEISITSDGQIIRDDSDEDKLTHLSPLSGQVTIQNDTFSNIAYDAELAAIFVLPLNTAGQMLFDPNPYAAPIPPQQAALDHALTHGSDLRTVQTTDGRRVRLLTYRLTRTDGPAALQLGRVLNDQDQVLYQLTIGLFSLGILSVIGIGLASWRLAGQAVRPVQAAWQRQQLFIANASHELRTPLTLIRASAEVALRTSRPDEHDQRDLLGDILTESDHMARLVEDLLLLSRLDSGRLSLTITDVALAPLLTNIHRQTARLGTERGMSVSLGSVTGVVRADPDRLHQILLILLDNALCYTAAGGTISITAEPQASSIRISVSDSGSGIAPEDLPHIFERFYRADPVRGRAGGHAGLGLAIAKGLTEAMNGQIGATSTLGQGTVVWLCLPMVKS